MTQKLGVACLMLALLGLVGMVHGQSPYRVEYFNNAHTSGAPDATLRLDNDGAAAGANLCADIFVFDSDEEMSECCSCLETPDGLRTLSVDSDLTANPLTGVTLTTGVIKIVAAAPTAGKCPPPSTISLVPDGEIQAWATHIQSTTKALTETASQTSSISSVEQKKLARQCGAIRGVGSGNGICTCGTGS
jgi:hypothetical protein